MTRRTLLPVLAVTTALSFVAGAALAVDGDGIGELVVISDATTTSSIQIDEIIPGSTSTLEYLVAIDADAPPSRLLVGIDDVQDLENGCNHAEAASGDLTCGPLGGELSQDLLLAASVAASGDCDDALTQALAPTSFADLDAAGDSTLLTETFTTGTERCLVLTVALPSSSGNETQTDAITFDLTITAESDFDDGAEVLGNVFERGDGSPDASSVDGLPATGTGVLALLAVGLGLATAGWLLLGTSRRRRTTGLR